MHADTHHTWHCSQVLNFGTHGVERDHRTALTYLRRAAEAGDAQAMGHLAHMLANGLVC